MMLPLLLAFSLSSTAAQSPPPETSAPTIATAATSPVATGRVWIGREDEVEEFIRTTPIDRFESIPVGVTRPRRGYFKPGGPVASVAFKVLPPGRKSGYYESYKSEIAAYKLDQLLGLDMVPPTVEKRHRGETGSAQLWVENCRLLKEKEGQTAPDLAAWNRQVYRQRVWDNLIANTDRNQGNLLVDEDWNLVLIDHSRAFTGERKMPFPMTRIDRPFYERMKALTEEDVRTHLRGLIFDQKALLRRRDQIVAHFEKLIAERGEHMVLLD